VHPGSASSTNVPYALTRWPDQGDEVMSLILIIVLLIILFGALPTWPYSRGWGYYPVGGVGVIVLIVVLLLLLGYV
jgi:hypothetical protein